MPEHREVGNFRRAWSVWYLHDGRDILQLHTGSFMPWRLFL